MIHGPSDTRRDTLERQVKILDAADRQICRKQRPQRLAGIQVGAGPNGRTNSVHQRSAKDAVPPQPVPNIFQAPDRGRPG